MAWAEKARRVLPSLPEPETEAMSPGTWRISYRAGRDGWMRYSMPPGIAVTNTWTLRVPGRSRLSSRENLGGQKFHVVGRMQAATSSVPSPRRSVPTTARPSLLSPAASCLTVF